MHAQMNTYIHIHNEYTKGENDFQVGRSNIYISLRLFQVFWNDVVGMLVQCSGKVQNANDILQEKFQSCSDNHFYRIKS